MEWFRHDCNAHDDLKIRKLLRNYGECAYGAYWLIVELLYQQGGSASYEEVSDTFGLMSSPNLMEILADSGLFQISDDGTWSSNRVKEEVEFQEESKKRAAENGRKGGINRAINAGQTLRNPQAPLKQPLSNPQALSSTLPNHTLPSNIPLSVSKETSSPTGKSVSPSSSKFQKPTLEEVKAYCKERHNSVNAEDFINYYDSVGWIVGKGKHMKDWKASVRTWEKDTKAPAPRKDLSDIGVQKVTKIDWGV